MGQRVVIGCVVAAVLLLGALAWAVPGKPKLKLGAPCSTAASCASAFCADGVCCSKACNGSCQVCTAARGAPTDGLCALSPDAPPGECAPYLCQGTHCPISCSTDDQCVAGTRCGADHACRSREPNGTPCTDPGACASGFCSDGFCCSEACDGACDVCSTDLGAQENGICTVTTGPGSPSCKPFVCNGQSASCPDSCVSAAQCETGYVCNEGKCTPKGGLGAACAGDSDCTDGMCSRGRCVAPSAGNGGACQADSDCRSRHCTDGVCCNTACAGACDRCDLPASFGTCRPSPAGDPGAPSCSPFACNGRSAFCPASCTSEKSCASGFTCARGRCVRKSENGEACRQAGDCASGSCAGGICCDTACGGGCETCAATRGTCTKRPAGSASQVCGSYLCDGNSEVCPTSCTTDSQCAAGLLCSAGECQPRAANGTVCSDAAQCSSGFCADGVCCDTACDGACDACNRPGAVGRCRADPAGSPGVPTCGAYVCDGWETACPTKCTSDKSCAAGFMCNRGVCMTKADHGQPCSRDDVCASGFCVDGVCCNKACDGACETCSISRGATADGICSPLAAGTEASTCGAFRCDGKSGSCPTACTDDSQCGEKDFCGGGVCTPRRGLGADCAGASGCTSGFCVDGVCCNVACEGQCGACDLPRERGVCSPTHGKPVGNRTPCTGDGSTCNGVCDGKSTKACFYPPVTDTCAVEGCMDGQSHSAAECDGTGHCGAVTTKICSPYVCGETACLTSCKTEKDCIAGDWCHGGVCAPRAAGAIPCSKGNECSSGHCASGVCCDSTCNGPCDRCDLDGEIGICAHAPRGNLPQPDVCGHFVCNGQTGACPRTCTDAKDCAPGFACHDDRCYPLLQDGRSCQSDAQCAEGHCVDGICCNSACDGMCSTCRAPDHLGKCTFISGQPPEQKGTCGGAGVCAGTCDGTGPDCHYPDKSVLCGEASCANAVATDPSACDTRGNCAPGATHECPTGCDGKQCGAKGLRTDDSGCASSSPGALAWVVLAVWLVALRRRRGPAALA